VRLYEEDEDEERCQRGVGAGEEFEGACKRRHGGGSDLNFYLLLALLSSSSLSLSLCLLPLSFYPTRDERRRNGERMFFSLFLFSFAFCTLPWCIINGAVPASCLVNNSMTTWRQRTQGGIFTDKREYLLCSRGVVVFLFFHNSMHCTWCSSYY
jgi:hypothetical protein